MFPCMVFIEDHAFARHRDGIIDDDELMELFAWLAVHPESGKIIPGSGGLRKLRWAASGRGKRGGARVIYFWWLSDEKILLLDIYAKKEKENLSTGEIKILRKKVIQ
jgi:hypothetical protein